MRPSLSSLKYSTHSSFRFKSHNRLYEMKWIYAYEKKYEYEVCCVTWLGWDAEAGGVLSLLQNAAIRIFRCSGYYPYKYVWYPATCKSKNMGKAAKAFLPIPVQFIASFYHRTVSYFILSRSLASYHRHHHHQQHNTISLLRILSLLIFVHNTVPVFT